MGVGVRRIEIDGFRRQPQALLRRSVGIAAVGEIDLDAVRPGQADIGTRELRVELNGFPEGFTRLTLA
jgi:hypothetical protein